MREYRGRVGELWGVEGGVGVLMGFEGG